MPRLTTALPKYRKHKGSEQAVVTLAGRDIYLGEYGSKTSKAEYDRLVSEWLAAGRPSRAASKDCSLTLIELMAAYLPYVRRRYVKNGKPTTEQERIRTTLRLVKKNYGRTLAVDFGPRALKTIRNQMVATDLARGTVNQNVNRIKRMFKWAASEELVPVTSYQALATVSGLRKGESDAKETSPIQPVPDADINATLPHLPPTVADMVRLQRLTGMRPGEVCIVRPCDIDRSEAIWRYQPESHKTEHHGRERVVFIGPKAQDILTQYLLRPETDFCFCPRDSERSRNSRRREERRSPMTPSQAARKPKKKPKRFAGTCYATASYRTAIRRACAKAGVPVWRPNQLRHTAATEIRRMYGLEAAQVALGHAAADVTQVYAERDAKLAQQVAQQMG